MAAAEILNFCTISNNSAAQMTKTNEILQKCRRCHRK